MLGNLVHSCLFLNYNQIKNLGGYATGYKLCMLIKELHEGSFSESTEKGCVITSCDNIQGLK